MLLELRRPPVALAVILFFVASGSRLFGYALEGPSWPAGSTVNMRLAFAGPSTGRLQDGFTTFNASAADALAIWNQQINLAKFSWTVSSIGGSQRDGQNTAFFSSTVYGQTYGPAIAVTVYFYNGSTMLEADNLFNSALLWDSYRGPVQYNFKKGKYVYDFHRVAIHEFGHTLGLAHPDDAGQTVTAIMNHIISDLDHLAADDIAGIKFLYVPRITSGLIEPNVLVGDPFSYQITANNNPTSYAASNLPLGVQLNTATGILSGSFSRNGTYNINIAAKGVGGWAIDVLEIRVVGPFITSLGTSVQVGDPFSYQITVTKPATSFEALGLPPGLQLNSSTGLITGKGIAVGNYPVTVIAHTALGDATATISIQVFAPYITSSLYPPAIHLGDSITYQITATNRPSSFDAQNLPAGLHLNSVSGQIRGAPTMAGSFSCQVVAHGTVGDATNTIHINVLPASITSPLAPPPTLIGDSFSYQITASNHPASFTATGLPAGLRLDPSTGLISGAPTLSGTYTVSITGHGGLGDLTGSIQIVVQPGDPNADTLVASINLAQYGDIYDIASDPQRSRIYIGCDKGLLVLDPATFSVSQLIPETFGVHTITISSDASLLWFAGGGISRIDLNTLTRLPDLPFSGSVGQIREGLGSRLYIGTPGNITQIDGTTGQVQTVFRNIGNPTGGEVIATSKDRKSLFAGDPTFEPSFVTRYDISTATPVEVQRTPAIYGWANEFALSHDGRFVCLSSQSNTAVPTPEVSAADLGVTYGQFTWSVPSYSALFSHDDKLVFESGSNPYGVNPAGGQVAIFDATSHSLLRTILLPNGWNVRSIATDLTDRYLFATSFDILVYQLIPRLAPPLPHSLTNVSTRAMVGTSDSVEIGGFIINGTQPKKILLRAIGPSLSRYGVRGAMPDPILELLDSRGAVVASNDNWNSNRRAILATGDAPPDEHECAILATLNPGGYTAVLHGLNRSTGVALFELYDLDPESSKIANISTRGNVGIADNVMIAGFIVGGDQPTNVIVRALGPTLTDFGVNGALADPTLELHDDNGTIIAQNDDWKLAQQTAIQNSGYAPSKDAEGAIMATLQPGNYSAIVRGKNNTTGVALVEVYNLDAN